MFPALGLRYFQERESITSIVRRVRIAGGRAGPIVGFGWGCRVVGATPAAESAAGPGRYTWQTTAT
ncbi:hypothetical protein ACLQ29_33495, partial [Micromonospora sp. DT228]|uniref:hypothetical protein n=1 Tax=Micromonospora sp. DT228 TaxID=3393443 RepID=UPI003CE6B1A9